MRVVKERNFEPKLLAPMQKSTQKVRRQTENMRRQRSEILSRTTTTDDDCPAECLDCLARTLCGYAAAVCDIAMCNRQPSSYCIMTIFLLGTLSWNFGFVWFHSTSDASMHPASAFFSDASSYEVVDSSGHSCSKLRSINLVVESLGHSRSKLRSINRVVDSSGHSRSKLRCMNLDSLSKSRMRQGERKTDEELLLWHSLSCDELLKDMTTPDSDDGSKSKCLEMESKYAVQPGRSWGHLPFSLRRQWTDLRCDCFTDVGCELIDQTERGTINKNSLNAFRKTLQIPYSITAEGIWEAVLRRPTDLGDKLRTEMAQKQGTEGETGEGKTERPPVIAVLVPTTSRGFRWRILSQVPVVRFVFPSIVKTVERGFIFRVYLGFDVGDLYFDNPSHIAGLAKIFKDTVEVPAKARNIDVQLILQGFQNSLRKPGPMFNFLSASAVSDGADYMYRINDDTELKTTWATPFTLQLAAFSPPNVGVVGPTCREGNYRILTHDFVHKTHTYIFGGHYPPMLMDWWMDDWISTVYGSKRTRKLPFVMVTHHLESTSDGENPVRYSVDWRHKAYLRGEVLNGQAAITSFIKDHCGDAASASSSFLGSSQRCILPTVIPSSKPNSTNAKATADSIPTAVLARDVLHRVAGSTWPLTGPVPGGGGRGREENWMGGERTKEKEPRDRAAAAAAEAATAGSASGCGCSWNCDSFFASDYGERLLLEQAHAAANTGKHTHKTDSVSVRSAPSYKACCQHCLSSHASCKIFSYDATTAVCNLTSIAPPKGQTSPQFPSSAPGQFGTHFICGKCSANQTTALLLPQLPDAADEGDVDCSKERGEMTAIGIDAQKQSMLCRRFLKAAAPTGYVMSSAVLKKFMGAHQVAWDEFEHFFEDLDADRSGDANANEFLVGFARIYKETHPDIAAGAAAAARSSAAAAAAAARTSGGGGQGHKTGANVFGGGMKSVQGNTTKDIVSRSKSQGGGGKREGGPAFGRGLSIYVNNTTSSRAGSAGSSNQMSTTSQNRSQNSWQVLSRQDPGFVNESHDWALEERMKKSLDLIANGVNLKMQRESEQRRMREEREALETARQYRQAQIEEAKRLKRVQELRKQLHSSPDAAHHPTWNSKSLNNTSLVDIRIQQNSSSDHAEVGKNGRGWEGREERISRHEWFSEIGGKGEKALVHAHKIGGLKGWADDNEDRKLDSMYRRESIGAGSAGPQEEGSWLRAPPHESARSLGLSTEELEAEMGVRRRMLPLGKLDDGESGGKEGAGVGSQGM